MSFCSTESRVLQADVDMNVVSDCMSSNAQTRTTHLGSSACDSHTGTIIEHIPAGSSLEQWLKLVCIPCSLLRLTLVSECMSPCKGVGWCVEDIFQVLRRLHSLERCPGIRRAKHFIPSQTSSYAPRDKDSIKLSQSARLWSAWHIRHDRFVEVSGSSLGCW